LLDCGHASAFFVPFYDSKDCIDGGWLCSLFDTFFVPVFAGFAFAAVRLGEAFV
jgi:hypothetical protein